MPQTTDPGALLGVLREALAKEYEIEGFVGRGSVGLVFKGVERTPKRAVALKVVPPGAAAGLGERVRREARVATNLVNANIVPIYKVGQAAGTDFYTMKWVDGCTLDWVLAEEGPLPVPLALTVLCSVARGLAYAHDRRVLHRDLRGAKVLVDREGVVAVADTGIARALREQGSEAAVGSPLFRSPEQCSGQQVGYQADQYALGVLAFQMLTGRLLFEADTEEALLELHVSAPPPEIGVTRSDVPQELVDVVRRALAKTPAERYETTREMLHAIQAVPLSEEEQKAAVEKLQGLAQRAPRPEVQTGAAAPEALAAAPVVVEAVREVPPLPEPPPAAAAEPPPAPAPEPLPKPEPGPTPEPERELEIEPPTAWPEPSAPLRMENAPAAPPPEAALPELDLLDEAPAPPPTPRPPRPSGLLVPLPAPPPTPTSWEPLPNLVLPPAAPPATQPPPEPASERGGWGPPPSAQGEWEAPRAPEPPAPQRSSPDAAVPPVEERYPEREPEPPPQRPSVERAAVEPLPRSAPFGRILGTAAVVGIAALAVVVLGKRVRNAHPSGPAADSARAAARADSIATFAPVPTEGWVKVDGDLPDDAILWLDDQQMRGLVVPALPGRHNLAVQTNEFQPWKTKIRVRLGDTVIVDVELVLKR